MTDYGGGENLQIWDSGLGHGMYQVGPHVQTHGLLSENHILLMIFSLWI